MVDVFGEYGIIYYMNNSNTNTNNTPNTPQGIIELLTNALGRVSHRISRTPYLLFKFDLQYVGFTPTVKVEIFNPITISYDTYFITTSNEGLKVFWNLVSETETVIENIDNFFDFVNALGIYGFERYNEKSINLAFNPPAETVETTTEETN